MTRRRTHLQMPSDKEIARRVTRAEEILGYTFKDKKLLIKAFTHPSAVEEKRVELSYERLEFLGDSFLGYVIAMEVYTRFPHMDEGSLSILKQTVVSGEMLSEIARELGYGDIIIFGNSERRSGGRGMNSALENVFESVIAALLIDGGSDVARDWIMRTVVPRIDPSLAKSPMNYKGQLQEITQFHGYSLEYRLVREEGPPHDCTFFSEALCDGKVIGSGSGRSKKEAEASAAQNALETQDKWLKG